MRTERSRWPDLVKGVAIVFVVFGHAWRGCQSAGLIPSDGSDLFHAIDTRIYAFHMPLFFIVAGLFLAGSIRRSTLPDYVGARVRRLIWPMLLWTYVFWLLKAAGGSYVNTPAEAVPMPIPGYLHLWFLWALFLLQIALFALRPALSDRFRGPTLWLLLAVSVMLATAPLPPGVGYWTSGAVGMLPYLALGMILGEWRGRWTGPAVLPIAVFCLLIAVVPTAIEAGVPSIVIAIAISACVILAAQTLSEARGPVLNLIASFGEASLSIYLLHTPFSALVRIALQAGGINNVTFHVVIGTLIGIAAPFAVVKGADRLAMRGWMGLGSEPVR